MHNNKVKTFALFFYINIDNVNFISIFYKNRNNGR